MNDDIFKTDAEETLNELFNEHDKHNSADEQANICKCGCGMPIDECDCDNGDLDDGSCSCGCSKNNDNTKSKECGCDVGCRDDETNCENIKLDECDKAKDCNSTAKNHVQNESCGCNKASDKNVKHNDKNFNTHNNQKHFDAEKRNNCCEKKEEKSEQNNDDLFTSLLRLQAEFDNYRKRTEVEMAKQYKNGFTDAVTDFLPALDSFKMAKEYITDKNTLVGIDYIEKGILKTLEKMGVTTIDATGKFDPNFHQAIDTSNAEGFEVGDIVKECYKGFKMGDKVIRFSQVIVKR